MASASAPDQCYIDRLPNELLEAISEYRLEPNHWRDYSLKKRLRPVNERFRSLLTPAIFRSVSNLNTRFSLKSMSLPEFAGRDVSRFVKKMTFWCAHDSYKKLATYSDPRVVSLAQRLTELELCPAVNYGLSGGNRGASRQLLCIAENIETLHLSPIIQYDETGVRTWLEGIRCPKLRNLWLDTHLVHEKRQKSDVLPFILAHSSSLETLRLRDPYIAGPWKEFLQDICTKCTLSTFEIKIKEDHIQYHEIEATVRQISDIGMKFERTKGTGYDKSCFRYVWQRSKIPTA